MTKSLLRISVALFLSACSQQPPNGGERAQVDSAIMAQEGLAQPQPVQLVREYVTRDSRGERLGANPWFRSVVDWPDEPGYDEFTVITGFDIRPLVVTTDTARVRVTYHRAGRIETGESSARFVADDSLEVETFVVARTGEGWRIVEPQINQHILAKSVLAAVALGDQDRATLAALPEP